MPAAKVSKAPPKATKGPKKPAKAVSKSAKGVSKSGKAAAKASAKSGDKAAQAKIKALEDKLRQAGIPLEGGEDSPSEQEDNSEDQDDEEDDPAMYSRGPAKGKSSSAQKRKHLSESDESDVEPVETDVEESSQKKKKKKKKHHKSSGKTRDLIPKPYGSAGKDGDGERGQKGYNLQEKMGLRGKKDKYLRIREAVCAEVAHYQLFGKKRAQDPKIIASILVSVERKFPMLQEFENSWPIVDILTNLLANKVEYNKDRKANREKAALRAKKLCLAASVASNVEGELAAEQEDEVPSETDAPEAASGSDKVTSSTKTKSAAARIKQVMKDQLLAKSSKDQGAVESDSEESERANVGFDAPAAAATLTGYPNMLPVDANTSANAEFDQEAMLATQLATIQATLDRFRAAKDKGQVNGAGESHPETTAHNENGDGAVPGSSSAVNNKTPSSSRTQWTTRKALLPVNG